MASAAPWLIEVRATFEGGALRGSLEFPPAVSDITVLEGASERTPEPYGRAWQLGCSSTCTVRYKVDLSSAAEYTGDSPSVAVRSGGDVLAPGSVWLMKPEPAAPQVKATLRVDASDPAAPDGEPLRFAAPFPTDARSGEHRLIARDIGALGYTIFGRFTTFTVPASKGSADVVVLRGGRAAGDGAIGRWVGATARAMDTVYGRFPIERVLVAVVPVEGSSEVEFGRTVPAGGASIVMFAGEHAGEAALMRDWVLAHEFFHLGVPSMARDGRWFDEGLATYYEPVLRARAGLVPESSPWAEFRSFMRKGIGTVAEPSLAAAQEHDRVYYGGSSFALTADVEIRRRTAQKRSLDDGLKQVLAEGGKATEVWSIDEFIAALDRGTGVPVVRQLFERVLPGAARCGATAPGRALMDFSRCAPDDAEALATLFAGLGISLWNDATTMDDEAPLAALRLRIAGVDREVADAVARVTRSDAPAAGNAGKASAKAGEQKP